jgi:uncharacterized membrane protein YphA (DoxX/SURF4 family)
MPSIRASLQTVPSSLIDLEYRKIPLEEPFLRRLFSSFARGWPGGGLLFIRIVAATALLDQAVNALKRGASHESTALAVLAASAGLLLLAGLWTPIAGAVVAVVEFWSAFSQPGDPWTYILLGSIGTALALLGPGAWSIDARIFGWKRIDIRDRQG